MKEQLEVRLPWIGSYFDIPQPESIEPLDSPGKVELEMHVLLKDLSVKKFILRIEHNETSGYNTETVGNFLNLAYIDDNAKAAIVYAFKVDDSGARRKDVEFFPYMRTGPLTWKAHYPESLKLGEAPEFIPSCLRNRF